MDFRLISLLLISFGLFALSACSGGSSERRTRLVTARNQNTHSCDFQKTEGDTVDMKMLSQTNLKKALFGKEYNSSLLEAVFAANVESSVKFMQQTGVSLYKASQLPTANCSSSLFGALPPMPADIAASFDSLEKESLKKEKTILGLYLAKDIQGHAAEKSLKDKAVIILRENTNRWTLVHEFMHHLFKLRLAEQGVDVYVQDSRIRQLIAKMNEIYKNDKTSEEQKITEIAPYYAQYAALAESMTLLYPLEEVATEVLMQNEYAAGKLKYVPISSSDYIKSNLNDANELLSNAVLMGYGLVTRADALNRLDVSQQIADAMKSIDTLRAEVDQIQKQYENLDSNKSEEPVGLVSAKTTKAHAGCAHQKITDDMLGLTKDALKIISAD